MNTTRLMILLACAAALSGCATAQEREARDDSVCVNARDYGICRQNLMSRRRDSAIYSSGN